VERWQKEALLAAHGDKTVLIREDTKADRVKQNNGAGGSQPTLLRKYVERAFEQAAPPAGTPVGKLRRTTYQLDQSFLQGPGRALTADFAEPALFAGLSQGVAQELRQEPYFFLGARGSGVGFHRHGEAWNAVVYGRKRWFLHPPEWKASVLGLDPDLGLDGVGYFKRFYPTVEGTPMAPIETVTVAGDVLYFPGSWHHATLNVQDTVGVFHTHAPPEWLATHPVPPSDFHWRAAPGDVLDASALPSEADRRRQCPGMVLVPTADDYTKLACLQVEVQVAVALLADYVWCASTAGGPARPDELEPAAVEDGATGIATLKRLLRDKASLRLLEAGDAAGATALSYGPSADLRQAVLARAAFVLGMSLQGEGPHREGKEGIRMALSGLRGGYSPVGFKEHLSAVETIRQSTVADDGERALREQAIRLVDAALALPSSTYGVNLYTRAPLLIFQAMFHTDLGQHAEAAAAYATSIAANPAAPGPYMWLAKALSSLGRHIEAAGAMRSLVEMMGEICTRCDDRAAEEIDGVVGIEECNTFGFEDRLLGFTSVKPDLGGCMQVKHAVLIMEDHARKVAAAAAK
jgi:hypothetical protein